MPETLATKLRHVCDGSVPELQHLLPPARLPCRDALRTARRARRSRPSASAATTSAAGSTSTATRRGRRRGARRRHHLLRHGRHLRQRRRQRALPRRAARGPARPGRPGDEVRHGHGRRRRPRGSRATTSAGARRGVARAPAHRPRRPLLLPPPGRRDADRGDARRDGRARARGQGARDSACSNSRRRAARRGRRARASERPDRGSSRVQNEYSLLERDAERRRAAALPRARRRLRPVLPARERAADRQVPPRRRRRPQGTRLAAAGTIGVTPRRSTGSRRSRRSRASAATRCSSSRSPRSPRGPAIASVIAGATSPSRCERTRPRPDWELDAGRARHRRPDRGRIHGMTRYLHTMLRITDPERSGKFYEALGFEFRKESPIVRDGQPRGDELLLRHPRPGRGARAHVQPRRPDVRARHRLRAHRDRRRRPRRDARALAEQGIEPEREPYRIREGGSRLCFVQDPDGYRVELIERSGK